MNYILEGDGNFNVKLMEAVCTNEDKREKCLISNKPLNKNFITLNCKHRFNYNDILKEVYQQKKNLNILETQRLKINEIKCPYCRSVQKGLLPYCAGTKKIKNVNWPPQLAHSLYKCTYKFKSGKKKGTECGIKCFKSHCWKHYKDKKINIICKGILKSGKRKGLRCTYIVRNSDKTCEYCKIHTIQKDNK